VVQSAATSSTVCGWWKKVRRGKVDEQRRKEISVAVYIIWHIWKEKGRRIFENESLSAFSLAGLIRADIELLTLGKGRGVDS
jgi:hypothetical protein